MEIENLLIALIFIVVDFVSLKIKFPLIQLLLGFFSCVVGALLTDLSFFPYINIIIIILGIGNIITGLTDGELI